MSHIRTLGNRTPRQGIQEAVRPLEHALKNIVDSFVTSILARLLGVRASPYEKLVVPAKRPIHGDSSLRNGMLWFDVILAMAYNQNRRCQYGL